MLHLLAAEIAPSSYAQLTTAVILVVGAIIAGLRMLGYLQPEEPKGAPEWSAEVELWKERSDRLSVENHRLTEENTRLHETRSIEPVMAMMVSAAEMQQATLDKLVSFNGTLRHIQDGFESTSIALRTATDGLGVVVALLQTLHDLPVVQHDRGHNLIEERGER